MKKYLLGLFAVVFAIGFSAFTTKSHHVTTTENVYYWYPVVYDETYPDGAIFPGSLEAHDVKSELSSLDCNGVSRDCRKAFTNQISFPGGGTQPLTDFSLQQDSFIETVE